MLVRRKEINNPKKTPNKDAKTRDCIGSIPKKIGKIILI